MLKQIRRIIGVGIGMVVIEAVGAMSVVAGDWEDYQRSFDLYREAYATYQIHKEDYVQAQTFAAEEKLIQSAKNMLMFRDDTWTHYWEITYNRYATITGATDKNKINWKTYVETETAWLAQHKAELAAQKTRNNLLKVANQLDVKNEDYVSKAFQINVDIVSGKLSEAIEQVKTLNKTLIDKAKNQNIDSNQQDVIVTGLNSNIERLNQLQFDAEIIKQDFLDEAGFADVNRFTTIVDDFKPLHQKLIQIMAVTRELSGNIQW